MYCLFPELYPWRYSGENFMYVFPIRIEDLKFGGKNSTYPVPSCFTFFSFTDQPLGYETFNPETKFWYICSSCAHTRLNCCRENKIDIAITLPIKIDSKKMQLLWVNIMI